MTTAPKFCLIAGGTLAVCVLAWSTSRFTFSQMEAMAKKKTEQAEESRLAEIARNHATLAAQAPVIVQDAPRQSLPAQPAPKTKVSDSFLATEARFANAQKEAAPPVAENGDTVNYAPAPPSKNTKITVAPAPGSYTFPQPKRKQRGKTEYERHLDSAMHDTLHPAPDNY